jgi:hypothetical protein
LKAPCKSPLPAHPRAYPTNTSGRRLTSNSRPGILVLINDADWELEGEDAYVLQPGDTVLFVSTLHGG